MAFKAIVSLKSGNPVSDTADSYSVNIDTNNMDTAEDSARLGFQNQFPELESEEVIVELVDVNPS